jgi:CBS domain-containing protein
MPVKDDALGAPDGLLRLLARDIMTPSPVTVGPETLLSRVMDLMLEHRIHHVPVLEKERYVGMVGESELHDAMPSVITVENLDARRRYLGVTQVSQVIARQPHMVSADAPLAQLIATMRTHRLAAVGVVSGGRLSGIITAGDLITLLEQILRAAERWPR